MVESCSDECFYDNNDFQSIYLFSVFQSTKVVSKELIFFICVNQIYHVRWDEMMTRLVFPLSCSIRSTIEQLECAILCGAQVFAIL